MGDGFSLEWTMDDALAVPSNLIVNIAAKTDQLNRL